MKAELVRIAKSIIEGEEETSPNMVGFVFQGRQYEGLVSNYLEYVWSNADVLTKQQDIATATEVVATSIQAVISSPVQEGTP